MVSVKIKYDDAQHDYLSDKLSTKFSFITSGLALSSSRSHPWVRQAQLNDEKNLYFLFTWI